MTDFVEEDEMSGIWFGSDDHFKMGSLSSSLSGRPESLYLDESRPESLYLDDMTQHEMEQIGEQMMMDRKPRRRKKKRASDVVIKKFEDLYEATGEVLGRGAVSSVLTHRNRISNKEYAVKIIEKKEGHSRKKVFKEVEIFNHCQGQEHILDLVEFFEEEDRFCLVFPKMAGGTLLHNIECRGALTEQEASMVVKGLATALNFLHEKGMAHRDLKPENILCERRDSLIPIKICDFDLGSGIRLGSTTATPITTPELDTPVGSAEFMAPEVVDAWLDEWSSYDKKCDMWSLGIILYIMLSGYPPFYGKCGADCGWDQGGTCEMCRSMLFQRIRDGRLEFPIEEWQDISEAAKDLIFHLLQRDPNLRYSAADVLRHPWVTRDAAKTPLATPRVLMRNNSTKDLEAFASDAIAVNRMVLQHLTISEPRGSLMRRCSRNVGSEVPRLQEDIAEFLIPVPTMGLSPPGESKLAKRRAQMHMRNCQSDEMSSSPRFSITLSATPIKGAQ
ncbi:MAP kinase-interacting serine/threonine-protein kinase 1-like isoform X2 [Lineus longissimus]|uniref:MAP kinase-interacting serine/threonine-protein kinase 1-like isoform X2 n=1 Tax=Lineus longissimus TaxID=88925 RepID=UPI002B4CDDB6